MKKLIPFGTLCILACVVFSSCNSSFEITKRRYNKGYYIDRSGNKDMTFITKEKASAFHPVKVTAGQNAKVYNSIQAPIASNAIIATSVKKPMQKTALPNRTEQIAKNLQASNATPVIQTIASVSALNSIRDGDDNHSRGDALSLFWLIILIVLIVWAIGLLYGGFGLGGFINVLLVIALVLLILWLLRII